MACTPRRAEYSFVDAQLRGDAKKGIQNAYAQLDGDFSAASLSSGPKWGFPLSPAYPTCTQCRCPPRTGLRIAVGFARALPRTSGNGSALESQVRELADRVRASEQDTAAARVLAGAADRDTEFVGEFPRDFRRLQSVTSTPCEDSPPTAKDMNVSVT